MNKQKSICIVTHRLAQGGLAKIAGNTSLLLEEQGYKVYVLTVLNEVEFDYGGKLINMGKYKSAKPSLWNRMFRMVKARRLLGELDIDLFLDFRTRTSVTKELFLKYLLFKNKVVYTVHNGDYLRYVPKSPFFFNWMYKNAKGLVCVSSWITGQLIEKYKYENIRTIYNGLDFNAIQQACKEVFEPKERYVLAVGHMNTPMKGFDTLLKAYASSELPKQDIYLYILGKGPLRSTYEQLAVELRIANKVCFLGFQQNPYKYYRKALFFVLSSRNEGFPTVLLESLACETPVIAFDCPSGPSEIVDQGQNGLLVENQNQEQLTASINLLLNDKDLYQRCKKNAFQSVKKFSFEVIGTQWKSYLNDKF